MFSKTCTQAIHLKSHIDLVNPSGILYNTIVLHCLMVKLFMMNLPISLEGFMNTVLTEKGGMNAKYFFN